MSFETVKDLLTELPNKGFFVEAGAHDGVGDSQTLTLEKKGWIGICVEPSMYFYGLARSRKCQIDNRALWTYDGVVKFRHVWDSELSGVEGSFKLDGWERQDRDCVIVYTPCCVLDTLLKSHKAPTHIDYFCLDTEGSETEILNRFEADNGFKEYTFGLACVEHNGVDTVRTHLDALFSRNGYNRVLNDGTNCWYKRKE